MAFPMLDTPRTELADQSRFSAAPDLDFSTIENAIPSPSRESNALLKQIQNMRAPNGRTPKPRAALVDRRNPPAKNEFTPLLKSATRNNGIRNGDYNKENVYVKTPMGLKASYRGDSPALPFNSSILGDNQTASSVDEQEGQGTPIVPHSSSSVLSTPMVALPTKGDGPLSNAGNLATLREQEARLEQIDKENFGLKLKIHFLEQALLKNGKEFNEAALKENTQLKIDNVQLDTDLKRNRKRLKDAEKALEEYKQQLLEYAEKIKKRHASEGLQEELGQLKTTLAEREAELYAIQEQLDAADQREADMQRLQDEIGDLEAELRDRERQLDEKEDALQSLKDNSSPDQDSLKNEIEERERQIEEREQDIQGLQEALDSADGEMQRKLEEKDRSLEKKDNELENLEDELKEMQQRLSDLEQFEDALKESQRKSSELQQKLEQVEAEATQSKSLKTRLENLQNDLEAEKRNRTRDVEEKDLEVHTLQQKLNSAESRDDDVEKLHDQVADLEAELRQQERLADEKDDEIAALKRSQQSTEDLNQDLLASRARIEELEKLHTRNMKELQDLREKNIEASNGRSEALEEAKKRVQELEDDQSEGRKEAQQLHNELNKLQGQTRRLEIDLNDGEKAHTRNKQTWDTERQNLKDEKARAEDQLNELRITLEHLQQSEGTLSDRELYLQSVLDSEKQRHVREEQALQRRLDEMVNQSNERLQELEAAKSELTAVKKELENVHGDPSPLEEKIQALEDEIEVLQMSLDEESDRAKDEIEAAQQEAEGLHRQVTRLQQDLSKSQTEHEKLKSELKSLRSGSGSQHYSPRALSTSPAKLKELQHQISEAAQQIKSLKESLARTSSDYDALQASASEAECGRDAAQQQVRELRLQLQDLRRESDRKQKSQVAAYEQDIHNLEQDLEDARAKQDQLTKASERAEETIARNKDIIKSLETQLARSSHGADRDTSLAERKDLHEMLKDAKLEAEDLAAQVRERDSKLNITAAKESELRGQLKRVREERAAQASKAEAVGLELAQLRERHEQLAGELTDAQTLNRTVRFPNTSLTASESRPADSMKQEKRHAAELRGLVKQIEYLSARCRREEAFRRDLSYVKQYFTAQVEMHGKCTQADLRLVRAMGIPTNQVRREITEEDESGNPGRRLKQREAGTRPTFRTVGIIVQAAVRMQQGAEKWRSVKGNHEALLKKLQGMRREKVGAGR